jgi:hypothetical protein
MASLIKTDRMNGLPQAVKGDGEGLPTQDGELVHAVLATPVQGVVNVDHSLAETPVRMRMVERVRELIAAGFYDRPEFLDLLAEKIRREF